MFIRFNLFYTITPRRSGSISLRKFVRQVFAWKFTITNTRLWHDTQQPKQLKYSPENYWTYVQYTTSAHCIFLREPDVTSHI
jgi:hypothetical protein